VEEDQRGGGLEEGPTIVALHGGGSEKGLTAVDPCGGELEEGVAAVDPRGVGNGGGFARRT
jgi:pimeloyl-ACP methyl ester carboxylesterase